MNVEQEKLDNAVCTALADLDHAPEVLSEALAGADEVQPQVLAIVKAANEHLGYGEWMEARTLLTAAHRMMARVRPRVIHDSVSALAGNRS